MVDQVAVLESIRDVLSGKGLSKAAPKNEEPISDDDEILDLTKMLNDDGSVTDLAAEKVATEAKTEEAKEEITEQTDIENKEEDMGTLTTKGDDVLDEIDKLLADDSTESKEEEKAAETAPEEAEEENLEPITDESVELELAQETKKEEEVMSEETETPEVAEENLISEESADKAKSAISDLLKVTGKNDKPKPATPSPSFRNGDTVEDLVMESLKPMLAKWLDENLSSLVEEIVQKEISRIIPK